MSWFTKILGKILPDDPEPGCGYGPFKLPADHPFTRGCYLHDFAFEQNDLGKAERTKEEEDVLLFKRWSLIAINQPTIEERIELIKDICRYWPLANKVGEYLW